jgi:hypothetical protein
VSGKIVLALTANPFYALSGVRPGMVLTAVAKHLGVGKAFHIGSNYWYLAPAGAARGVVKVRGGVIPGGRAREPAAHGRKPRVPARLPLELHRRLAPIFLNER